MANKTPLATWLYSKRTELNPRFREFNWPGKFLPGLFDFSTTIVWNGIQAEGRGVDARRGIALEKSVAESIERLICKTDGFDSVGFAVAGTHDPTLHAQFEALERYFLEQHIESRSPFQFIESSEAFSKEFRSLNVGAEISFYRMATPENLFGLVCSIASPNHANSLGFALSESLEDSFLRATLEALPNYAWLNDKDSDVGYEGAESIPWHVGADFLAKINPLLKITNAPENRICTFEIPKLQKVDVPHSTISILRDAPIQTARFTVQVAGELK